MRVSGTGQAVPKPIPETRLTMRAVKGRIAFDIQVFMCDLGEPGGNIRAFIQYIL